MPPASRRRPAPVPFPDPATEHARVCREAVAVVLGAEEDPPRDFHTAYAAAARLALRVGVPPLVDAGEAVRVKAIGEALAVRGIRRPVG